MSNLLTYAVLEAVKERRGNVTSILDVYQDLVETSIKRHFNMVSKKGLVEELRDRVQADYSLLVPISTLQFILTRIGKAHPGNFRFNGDFSFDFSDIEFVDIEKTISDEKEKLAQLEAVFEQSKRSIGFDSTVSLAEIIDRNKSSLLSFFSNAPVQARFESSHYELLVAMLRIPEHRIMLERLFLGAIMSCFTELEVDGMEDRKTILVDTNFVISLLDLHSQESKESCDLIIRIGGHLKYDFCILPETIVEIENLLYRKSNEIPEVPVFAAQDRESIEHGCFRRGISGRELRGIEKKVRSSLSTSFGIRTLEVSQNDSLKNRAKVSDFYTYLSRRTKNKEGALHDAMALLFVKDNRTGDESSFSDTPSFFLTDSHGYAENRLTPDTKLPLMIRAEELVNILWLLNPYQDARLAKAEISKIFALFLKGRLPNKELLSAIDRKNRAYRDLKITHKECVRLAFDINEASNSELEKLLSIRDEATYIDELRNLAEETSRRREERESRITELTETAIDETWIQKNKDVLNQNEALRQSFLKEQENSREMALREKRELGQRIEALELLVSSQKGRIEDLQAPIESLVVVVRVLIYLVALGTIATTGSIYIIPHWQEVEPATFLLGIGLPLLLGLAETIGIKVQSPWLSISKSLTSLFYKKRRLKLLGLSDELKANLKKWAEAKERFEEILF